MKLNCLKVLSFILLATTTACTTIHTKHESYNQDRPSEINQKFNGILKIGKNESKEIYHTKYQSRFLKSKTSFIPVTSEGQENKIYDFNEWFVYGLTSSGDLVAFSKSGYTNSAKRHIISLGNLDSLNSIAQELLDSTTGFVGKLPKKTLELAIAPIILLTDSKTVDKAIVVDKETLRLKYITEPTSWGLSDGSELRLVQVNEGAGKFESELRTIAKKEISIKYNGIFDNIAEIEVEDNIRYHCCPII